MKLFKRANSPYWWYSFTAKGKRHRGSTKRPLSDRAGAKRYLSKLYCEALNKNQFGEKPEITLKDALDLTLLEVVGQTHRLYSCAAAKHVSFFGSETRLSSIQQEDLDRWLVKRQQDGLKPNTINSELKALARAIRRVSRSHRVNNDLVFPKLKSFAKSRYLSKTEEQAILATLQSEKTITSDKSHDLAVVLLDTGMRLMEAVNLHHDDLDLSNKLIEVYRPKTKSLSLVPMSERVNEVFSKRSEHEAPFERMEFAIRHLRKTIGRLCNGDCTLSQRGKATIHSLRDTFATRMLRRGMTLHELANLLGHSNTAMTAKYAHLEKSDVINKARELLNVERP